MKVFLGGLFVLVFNICFCGVHSQNVNSFSSISENRTLVSVSSLAELRQSVTKNNQEIVMQPGHYSITQLPEEQRTIVCSGSNNSISLYGVYISFPVGTCNDSHFKITGSNNQFQGGTFEDTYQNGMEEVTDFGSYNQNRKTLAKGLKGKACMEVSGNNNTVMGIKMIVRGSFPYGYGNMYGIGRNNATGLNKRCALLITGVGNTIDHCEFKHRAFGHVIYMQKNADKTVIKNTYIEGAVRPSNDVYNETNDGDLPKRFNYKMPLGAMEGLPVPRDVMFNLTEDGIRAYNIPGSVTVDNCTVVRCRGGIKLYMAKGNVKVSNSTVIDCVVEGYSLNNGGEMINCKGNAAYGPLLYMHFNNVSNQKIDLTVLPAPHAVGNHVFAAIKGKGHQIKLKRAEFEGEIDRTLRPIVVGYPARFEFLTTDYPNVPKGYEENFKKHFAGLTYKANTITIENQTEYPVVLGTMSEKNEIKSLGTVTDLGKHNKIVKVDSGN